MTGNSSRVDPTFTSSSGNKLVDKGQHWFIETPDGTQFDTERRKLKDAKGVLEGFENIDEAVSAGASLTDDPLTDLGKNFGTTLSNNQTVDLGKTRGVLAENLMSGYRDYFSDDPNSAEFVGNTGMSSTADTLVSDGSSNVSDEALAIAAENAATAVEMGTSPTAPTAVGTGSGSGSDTVTGDGNSIQEIVNFASLENKGYSPEELIQKKQELIAEAERRRQIRQMIARNRLRRFGGTRLLMSQDRFSPGVGVSDYAQAAPSVRFNPREG